MSDDADDVFMAGSAVRYWRDWLHFQAARWRIAEHNLDHPGLTYFEAHLFAVTLNNVRRAAEHAGAVTDSPTVRAALISFDAAVPDAKNLRDALEHFDDYVRNEGRLQMRGDMKSFKVTFGSTSADTAFVEIPPLRFNTGEALRAADELANAVLEELRGLLPSSPNGDE